MITRQFTQQVVQNYRKPVSKTRHFNQALIHTYASFAEQYPEWVAALFDKYFFTHRAMPLLTRVEEGSDRVDPAELAKVWSEQLTWSNDQRRQSIIAELTPVAATFLRTFKRKLSATIA